MTTDEPIKDEPIKDQPIIDTELLVMFAAFGPAAVQHLAENTSYSRLEILRSIVRLVASGWVETCGTMSDQVAIGGRADVYCITTEGCVEADRRRAVTST